MVIWQSYRKAFAFLGGEAFPDDLFLGEVQDPRGQEAFLKDPASSVELRITYFTIPVLVIANVIVLWLRSLSSSPQNSRQDFASLPGSKQPAVGII